MAELTVFARDHWLQYYGELHLQYRELPIWILISEHSSICKAHQELLKLYQPFREVLSSLQLNIYFYRKQDDSKYCQFFAFQNSQDFLDGLIDDKPLIEDSYDKLEKHNINIFNRFA